MQPRIKGQVRQPVGSSFMDALEKAVNKEARRFNVSRSFVIAVAVADSLGVSEQPLYQDVKVKPRLLRMVR